MFATKRASPLRKKGGGEERCHFCVFLTSVRRRNEPGADDRSETHQRRMLRKLRTLRTRGKSVSRRTGVREQSCYQGKLT